jgi:triosephosphate isomerase
MKAGRTPIIAGNWKMNTSVAEAVALARAAKDFAATFNDREVMVAPPFPWLVPVREAIEGSSLRLGAQDMHHEPSGAFTGAVSAGMLKEAGCTHVIIGHSERRQFFGETDESVNKKTKAALAAGLVPVVCVGETLPEREAGKVEAVVGGQVSRGLAGIPDASARLLVVAYEPVWAIGTGKTASSAQAQEVHAFVRGELAHLFGKPAADAIRIQYGGSVKPDNVDELMAQPDIDGALVGGASLKADAFTRIVNFKKA